MVEIVDGNVTSVWLPAQPNVMYTIEVIARLPDDELEYIGKMPIATENGN